MIHYVYTCVYTKRDKNIVFRSQHYYYIVYHNEGNGLSCIYLSS